MLGLWSVACLSFHFHSGPLASFFQSLPDTTSWGQGWLALVVTVRLCWSVFLQRGLLKGSGRRLAEDTAEMVMK